MRLFYWLIFFQTVAFGQSDTLNVLSWNTFLRPAILSDDQMSRVDDVAAFLDSTAYEVLVLQEVFHRKARKKLINTLKGTYPNYTKRGRNSILGVSSGVLIFSKYPIKNVATLSFKKSKGSDSMAKKGVVKAVLEVEGRAIEIFGTHLQAGAGMKREEIRISQIEQLSEFLSESSDTVIQIVAGDFNINEKVSMYDTLVATLEVDAPELDSRQKFTANFADQQLFETSGSPKWIDFIFLRRHDALRMEKAEIHEPRRQTEAGFSRISDHNPIVVQFVMDSN